MLVQTITVENDAGQASNATVLCAFAIPQIDRNLLVYTLNEEENGCPRIYVASAVPQARGYRLERLGTSEWQHVLQVLNEVTAGGIQ
ncbi:MAG: hypothetical protein GAK43_02445 [Stenotrophomonas maltophilia]|nr:MAG: hypothetical protein GAK43_02445 [Stenotrophomonas maltophilia]